MLVRSDQRLTAGVAHQADHRRPRRSDRWTVFDRYANSQQLPEQAHVANDRRCSFHADQPAVK